MDTCTARIFFWTVLGPVTLSGIPAICLLCPTLATWNAVCDVLWCFFSCLAHNRLRNKRNKCLHIDMVNMCFSRVLQRRRQHCVAIVIIDCPHFLSIDTINIQWMPLSHVKHTGKHVRYLTPAFCTRLPSLVLQVKFVIFVFRMSQDPGYITAWPRCPCLPVFAVLKGVKLVHMCSRPNTLWGHCSGHLKQT